MALDINLDMQEYLKGRLEELLQQEDMLFSELKPSGIPERAGVYLISNNSSEPYYVGRTKNLRQRLYNNHLMGSLTNACLKKYLIDNGVVSDKEEAKTFILQNCKVRWIFEDDYRKRGALEGYFKGIFFPKYGIDEEH